MKNIKLVKKLSILIGLVAIFSTSQNVFAMENRTSTITKAKNVNSPEQTVTGIKSLKNMLNQLNKHIKTHFKQGENIDNLIKLKSFLIETKKNPSAFIIYNIEEGQSNNSQKPQKYKPNKQQKLNTSELDEYKSGNVYHEGLNNPSNNLDNSQQLSIPCLDESESNDSDVFEPNKYEADCSRKSDSLFKSKIFKPNGNNVDSSQKLNTQKLGDVNALKSNNLCTILTDEHDKNLNNSQTMKNLHSIVNNKNDQKKQDNNQEDQYYLNPMVIGPNCVSNLNGKALNLNSSDEDVYRYLCENEKTITKAVLSSQGNSGTQIDPKKLINIKCLDPNTAIREYMEGASPQNMKKKLKAILKNVLENRFKEICNEDRIEKTIMKEIISSEIVPILLEHYRNYLYYIGKDFSKNFNTEKEIQDAIKEIEIMIMRKKITIDMEDEISEEENVEDEISGEENVENETPKEKIKRIANDILKSGLADNLKNALKEYLEREIKGIISYYERNIWNSYTNGEKYENKWDEDERKIRGEISAIEEDIATVKEGIKFEEGIREQIRDKEELERLYKELEKLKELEESKKSELNEIYSQTNKKENFMKKVEETLIKNLNNLLTKFKSVNEVNTKIVDKIVKEVLEEFLKNQTELKTTITKILLQNLKKELQENAKYTNSVSIDKETLEEMYPPEIYGIK